MILKKELNKKECRNNIAITVLSSISEWYEFVVYGFFVPILSTLFFPSHHRTTSILAALGAFAAGFLARPVGALLYGHFGDRSGRRKVLSTSIILMGVVTVLMGCLPTYHKIGFLAPLLLVVIRILQGLSVGGQFPGASIFISEHIDYKYRFFGAGLAFASAFIGMTLASAVGTIVTSLLTPAQLLSWGWRLPFLLGVVVILLGFYLREKATETPVFLRTQKRSRLVKTPIREIFKTQKIRMILTVLVCWFASVIVYLLFIFMPTYVHTYLHISIATALKSNAVAMVVLTISTIFFGYLADKLGFQLIMIAAAILLFIFAYSFYRTIADHRHHLLLVQLLLAVISGGFIGPMMGVLTFLFPVHIRYTALSFSYNVSFGLFGGTAALGASFLLDKTGDLAAPSIYVMITAVISSIALIFIKNYTPNSGDLRKSKRS